MAESSYSALLSVFNRRRCGTHRDTAWASPRWRPLALTGAANGVLCNHARILVKGTRGQEKGDRLLFPSSRHGGGETILPSDPKPGRSREGKGACLLFLVTRAGAGVPLRRS